MPSVSEAARQAIGTLTWRHVSGAALAAAVAGVPGRHRGRPRRVGGPGTAGKPVPPLFFHAACRPIVAEGDLREDGQYAFLGVAGVEGMTMSGGMRFEILAPVYLGDVLTVEERLTSIEEEAGRSGPRLVMTTTLAEYRNQSGALVARYRQTIIFR